MDKKQKKECRVSSVVFSDISSRDVAFRGVVSTIRYTLVVCLSYCTLQKETGKDEPWKRFSGEAC